MFNKPRRVGSRQALGLEAAKRKKRSYASNIEEGRKFLKELEDQTEAASVSWPLADETKRPRQWPSLEELEAEMARINAGDTIYQQLEKERKQTTLWDSEGFDKKRRDKKSDALSDKDLDDEWIEIKGDEIEYFLKDGGGAVASTVPEEYVLVRKAVD